MSEDGSRRGCLSGCFSGCLKGFGVLLLLSFVAERHQAHVWKPYSEASKGLLASYSRFEDIPAHELNAVLELYPGDRRQGRKELAI